jgi:hypothetical protein
MDSEDRISLKCRFFIRSWLPYDFAQFLFRPQIADGRREELRLQRFLDTSTCFDRLRCLLLGTQSRKFARHVRKCRAMLVLGVQARIVAEGNMGGTREFAIDSTGLRRVRRLDLLISAPSDVDS